MSTLEKASQRRRGRPAGSGFELYSWLFMRISGVVLLGLAVFHLYWMHMVLGVENIDFQVVAERWQNPFWKLYDLFLLAFALTHGMNGLRFVINDYIRKPRWLVIWKSTAFLLYVLLIGAGAYVILTFQPEAWGVALR